MAILVGTIIERFVVSHIATDILAGRWKMSKHPKAGILIAPVICSAGCIGELYFNPLVMLSKKLAVYTYLAEGFDSIFLLQSNLKICSD